MDDVIVQGDDNRANALDWLLTISKMHDDMQEAAGHHLADADLLRVLHRCEAARDRIERALTSAFALPAFYIPPNEMADIEKIGIELGQTTAICLLVLAAKQHNLNAQAAP